MPRIGPYELLEPLGTGGMGTVYRARPGPGAPAGLPDAVALKVLHPDLSDTMAARFLRESRLGIRIRVPHVMQIFDALTLDDGTRALVMELVPGQSLRDVLRNDGPFADAVARHVAMDVAAGLAALHARGVLHRDVKPENVILTPDGVAKLVDLGIARHEEDATRITGTGQFVGSLLHAAPEQFSGIDQTDARSDLFSLGGLLFEVLAGAHPFYAGTVGEVLKNILHQPTPNLQAMRPDVDPLLVALVHHLLEKSADARPASAQVVLDALRHGRQGRWWQEAGRQRVAEFGSGYRPVVERPCPFVGRASATAQLDDALATARTGRAVLAVIEGEHGMGKSRLIDAWLSGLDAVARPRVIGGGWPQSGAQGGLAGLRVALGSLPEAASDPQLQSFLTGAGDLPPSSVLDEAIASALGRHAGTGPLILVLEDLGVAGADGIRAVAALMDVLAAHPVLFLVTARTGALETLAQTLSARRPVVRIALTPLGASEAVALLEALLGNTVLAQDLVGPLMDRAGGSPFHLIQLVRALESAGAITRTASGHPKRADRSLETSLADVASDDVVVALVRARLDALGDETRELVDMGACLGRAFDPGEVARLLGRDPLGVLRSLGRIAREGGVLAGHGRMFAFATPRVTQAVLHHMPDPLQFAYRSAIAADRGRVFEKTQRGQDALRVLPYAAATGNRALVLATWEAAVSLLEARHEWGAAAEHLRALLDTPDLVDGAHRVAMLLRIADPTRYGGAYVDLGDRLAEAAALAEAAGDHASVARAALFLGRVRLDANQPREAGEACARAVEAASHAGDHALAMRADLLLATVAKSQGALDDAKTRLRHVIDAARAADLPALEGRAHQDLAALLRQHRFAKDAQPHLEASERIARALGSDKMLLVALNELAFFAFLEGDWPRAEGLLREALGLAEKLGDRLSRTRQHANLGQIMLLRGELGTAWHHAEHAVAWGRTLAVREPLAAALRLVVRLGALCGCFEDAWEAVEELRALGVSKGPVTQAGFLSLSEGVLRAAEGDDDGALSCYADAERQFREAGHDNGVMFVLLRKATTYEQQDRWEEIAPLMAQAREIAKASGATPVLLQCDVLHALATRAPLDALRQRRADAASALTPHIAAYLDYCLYRASGDDADLHRARDLLERAAATLEGTRAQRFRTRVADHRRILGLDD